ncbi:electron transfer flavoprotein subunit alpha/FixB family protein [Actinomycetota bacterium]
MSVLVVIEREGDRVAVVSREALTFARGLDHGEVHAIVVGKADERVVADCAAQGVATVYEVSNPELERYAAAAWGAATEAAGRASRSDYVVAGGTPRGCEILAHVAARRSLPMAANVVSVVSTEPLEVERQVVGGAALERMSLTGRIKLMAMAGHAVEPVDAPAPGAATVTPLEVTLGENDLVAQVVREEQRESADTSALTGARVVVGAGRGAGSADGFGDVDALAARLGGAVGVSRVVTSLGWRPHHEQIGQTGSRIAPDVYIACGISGAIQHWAGCATSKTIIAVNTDEEAPMVTKAKYAVVGDMHEVLPAVLDALP